MIVEGKEGLGMIRGRTGGEWMIVREETSEPLLELSLMVITR